MTGAILAIDPGFAACGVAAFHPDGRLIDADALTTAPGEEKTVTRSDARRCRELAAAIQAFGRRAADEIQHVVIEGFMAARSHRAGRSQALTLGAISILCWTWEVELLDVSPHAVKKLAAGEIDFVRQEVKPRRARLRELREAAAATTAAADALMPEISRLEAELRPLERQRAKAEKDAMIAFAERRHPEFDVRRFGSKAEHVADAIAVFWAAKERGR